MNILRGLVLAVALMHLAPALAQAPRQATASAALQSEFAAFIATFRGALKANDAAAVTGMTKHPFETGDYPDAAQFRTKGYPKIFTPKTRACIQRTKGIYERAPNGDEYYSVFCGDHFIFTKTPAGFLFTYISPND